MFYYKLKITWLVKAVLNKIKSGDGNFCLQNVSQKTMEGCGLKETAETDVACPPWSGPAQRGKVPGRRQ